MSVVDEDTELRDLLVQTLDKNGVLGKIKVSKLLQVDKHASKNAYFHMASFGSFIVLVLKITIGNMVAYCI